MLKQTFILIFSCLICFSLAEAQENNSQEFQGSINADNINIRADANITSPVICNTSRPDAVNVVLEKYDWYKIRLPKSAPCYVKKTLLLPVKPEPQITPNKKETAADGLPQTAKALKGNINIRLKPDQASAILGKIEINEIVTIVGENGDWYKIEPARNAFGWIHKKFVDKTLSIPTLPPKTEKIVKLETPPKTVTAVTTSDEIFTVEGIVQTYGKVINRVAEHKLITKGQETFLLKGSVENLRAMQNHKVRIEAKRIVPAKKQKYPVLEIIKMEDLD